MAGTRIIGPPPAPLLPLKNLLETSSPIVDLPPSTLTAIIPGLTIPFFFSYPPRIDEGPTRVLLRAPLSTLYLQIDTTGVPLGCFMVQASEIPSISRLPASF